MSGKQKALLIALAVVLVVLIVVAFGSNAGKKQGDPGKPNSIVNFLSKFGAKGSAVDPATVSANCTPVQNKPNTYTFTTSCTLTVKDPGKMKMLKLQGNRSFHATAPAPGGADFTVDADASPSPTGAKVSVAVDKRTEVTLDCPGGLANPCIVTVEAE